MSDVKRAIEEFEKAAVALSAILREDFRVDELLKRIIELEKQVSEIKAATLACQSDKCRRMEDVGKIFKE